MINPTQNPGLAHCASHPHHHADCAVCKQAVANNQPYPVRKSTAKPSPRSFGYDDNLTEEKLRGPSWSSGRTAFDEPEEVTLSLAALRFIVRLIWPFGKIF